MTGVGAKCTQEAARARLAPPWSPPLASMQRCYGRAPRPLGLSPIGVLCFSMFWVAPVMLHPQCLDFKPPFRPLRELEFCVMYKEFGCCDYQKDQELMARFYQVMDHFDYHGYANCAGFVLELLCQVGMHGQRSLCLVQHFSIMRRESELTANTLVAVKWAGDKHFHTQTDECSQVRLQRNVMMLALMLIEKPNVSWIKVKVRPYWFPFKPSHFIFLK